MQRFVFLEHTADIKFQAFGKSIEECFENSARAMVEAECSLKSIKPKEERKASLKAESKEELLHRFLEEVLFLMETEQMLFSDFKLEIQGNSLKGKLIGEKADKKRHEFKAHAKAVTWNSFGLEKEKGLWKATVVLDI